MVRQVLPFGFFRWFGWATIVTSIFAAGCGPPPSATQAPQQGNIATVLPTTQPKQADPSSIRKIDSNLRNLVADYLSGKDAEQAARTYGITINNKKEVLVDIYVNDSVTQASSQLTKLGMTVQSTNESFKIVEGTLSIDLVFPAAQLDVVKAILPVVALSTNQTQP